MSDQPFSEKHYEVQKIVRRTFILCLSIYFFYFLIRDDWFHIDHFLYFIILAIALTTIIWFSMKIDQWLDDIRFHIPIRVIASVLILFFFMYQLFTPYFYSDQKLVHIGKDVLESYYALTEEEDFKALADAVLNEEIVFSSIEQELYPEGKLIDINVDEVSRSLYLFDLTSEVEKETDGTREQHTYRFTFAKEYGDFKLKAYVQLD
ncbi:hypothetical protein MUN88_08575 [Gracilibacillus caseinilyticus]|uniref:Uncharacterized protein n=1 Tax=Gracilibacillus caseinilyticus TaxID=2932256 RepID=A0ABY4F1Q6_9BACI|nr:hypothetical protein [Gracilibacillus caseinilyticus]UOQ50097.1 hypothetical protein MUN88_08575 [Gracilibacillus caseinilyticus]